MKSPSTEPRHSAGINGILGGCATRNPFPRNRYLIRRNPRMSLRYCLP